jgi:amidase
MAGPHRAWLQAQEARHHHRRAWRRFFEDWDILLAPVIASPPILHDQTGTFADRTVVINGEPRPYLDLVSWTTLIGGAELPSTVVPVGLTGDGLPVGIQVIGPHLEDRTALAAARVVEQLLGGFRPPPLAST